MKKLSVLLALFLFVFATAPLQAQAAEPAMADLGTNGGDNSIAYGINNSGQIVGTSTIASIGYEHAFFKNINYPNVPMTDLGTLPGGNRSTAYGINNSGQIVGSSETASGDTHAFLKNPNGAMTDLGTLGGTYSYARAINDLGQIVGRSSTASGETHVFLKNPNAAMTDLGPLGGGGEIYSPMAINNSGQIVGFYFTPGSNSSNRAFLYNYNNNTLTDLGTLPGGTSSEAHGINDSGHIVGCSTTASGAYHAFLYNGLVMADLGTFGGIHSFARGINNSGQITGWFMSSGYKGYAFLYDNNGLINLGGQNGSEANAINDLGQVVGWFTTDSWDTHAFISYPGGDGPICPGGIDDDNTDNICEWHYYSYHGDSSGTNQCHYCSDYRGDISGCCFEWSLY